MGYDRFSNRVLMTSTINDPDEIVRVFENTGVNKPRLVNGLLNLHQITPDNLANYLGGDPVITRCLISDLVILNCLKLEGRYYLKNPAFREWLKNGHN